MPQLYNSEALPFTYGPNVVIELVDKFYNSVTVFLCLTKVCLSHRSQAGYVSICAGAAENSIVSNVCLKSVKWQWLLQSSFRYNLALNGRSIINLIKNCLLQWGWNWALHHNLGDLYKRRAGFGRSTFARNSAVCVQDCQKSTVFLGDGFVIFHTEQLSIYC